MAKLSMKLKQSRPAKFSTRAYTRCRICGRPHSVLRKYLILDLSVEQWANWIIANFSVYGKFQSVCIDLLAYITIYHNSIDCIFCS